MKRQTRWVCMITILMLALNFSPKVLANETLFSAENQPTTTQKEEQPTDLNQDSNRKKVSTINPITKPALKKEAHPNIKEKTENCLPLAKAKKNVKIELNSPVKPNAFVTAKKDVQLHFKTKPNTAQIGTKKVVVLASNNEKKEEITVPFTVQDKQKPKITLLDNDILVNLNELLSPDDFVIIEDNSNDYEISFTGGRKHLDTSKVGLFSTQIIARDKAGNESSVTLRYEVIDHDPGYNEGFDYKAPQINKEKSTNTTIYGKTEPNLIVGVFNKAGELLGETLANARGEFQVHLKEGILKRYQVVEVQSFDAYGPELSDIAEYWYKKAPTHQSTLSPPTAKAPIKSVTPKPVTIKTKKEINKKQAKITNKTPTKMINKIPKTGDQPSLYATTFLGTCFIGLALFCLRRRA